MAEAVVWHRRPAEVAALEAIPVATEQEIADRRGGYAHADR